MLSLMIPLEGMPWFEYLPEKRRGDVFEMAVRELNIGGGRQSYFSKRLFKWNSQYARGNKVRRHIAEPMPINVIFDVFEEVE